ncbi:MAG TPA: mannose-1-phosphate guanylyltransferase [Marmoricola sp.]|nr:mannose-1-phosphate guanylyltransferase [Marmoricola sp.]
MANVTDAATAVERLWAVVPAGGAGTRLWPLSRATAPKFLLDLTGSGRTLLQQTCDRLEPLVGDRLMVVTGAPHAAAVCDQVSLEPGRVLVEPSPRDSMAAIGWAAAVLERENPDALMASFAADQVIVDDEAFRECVREAAEVADGGRIVTLGINPTGPSTAFGYIKAGKPLDGFATACSVEAFVEKPDAARAAEYVATGEYRWNAGMFVVRASVLLDELAREHPALAASLRAIAADPSILEETWEGLTKIAIDHAVAEPAAARSLVAVVPGSFGWDDIGDFESLSTILGGGNLQVLGDASKVTAIDSSGLVVAGDRQVCVLGLEDIVVVDTGDALLVANRAQAQRVKEIVAAIKASGLDELA